MALSTILDSIVERIERYSPTQDGNKKYRRVDKEKFSNRAAYRNFYINLENLDYELAEGTGDRYQTLTASIDLVFVYTKSTENFTRFKRVVDDSEELFQRLIYTPSSQWLTNATVFVDSFGITEDDDLFNINIQLRIIYTL